MRTKWTDNASGEDRQVTSPVSLVVSAFAALPDVRGTLTPQLEPDSALVLVDLGAGANRLGGSMLAQVSGVFGGDVPDLDDPARLIAFVDAMSELRSRGLVSAYHDRSDGGLWATVCEMAFASGLGVEIAVDSVEALFTEELGAVLGVRADSVSEVREVLTAAGVGGFSSIIGGTNPERRITVSVDGEMPLDESYATWPRRGTRCRGASPRCVTTRSAPTRSTQPLGPRTTRAARVDVVRPDR